MLEFNFKFFALFNFCFDFQTLKCSNGIVYVKYTRLYISDKNVELVEKSYKQLTTTIDDCSKLIG